MTDETEKEKLPKKPPVTANDADAEEAERRFGRAVAYGIPIASVVGAVGMGVVASAGPAILVLASGALLGTVALFWASLRTLGGDAPLPHDLAILAARTDRVTEAEERKTLLLRALKDLEHEHAVGKLDDDDYEELAARYRAEAKEAMRAIDEEIGPLREKAEAIARRHLEKRGIASNEAPTGVDEESAPPAVVTEGDLLTMGAESARDEDEDEGPPSSGSLETAEPPPVAARIACSACETSNEPDAAFCKKCGHALTEAADASA